MTKLWIFILLLLCPLLGLAADGSAVGTVSFSPPPGDNSVIFLGNIFGQVDGVLHGSGSQIMGKMFAVFNAAVLALGGMIITYTLLVSTMNTAQEGEMLGKKWSSIWVPVRATGGLALLMPKASGYCLIQIFVMWVVVQGVGAADMVWNTALGYLNRGGVIIHAQTDPTQKILDAGKLPGLNQLAASMLSGQVCMLGLQKLIEQKVNEYREQEKNGMGPCYVPTFGTPPTGSAQYEFGKLLFGKEWEPGKVTAYADGLCKGTIPNMVDTVDIVKIYNDKNNGAFMPGFESGNQFQSLNGICGKIVWTNDLESTNNLSSIESLTKSDIDDAGKTKGVAMQQLFFDLHDIAQVMVSNNPKLLDEKGLLQAKNAETWATQPFGHPVSAIGKTQKTGKLLNTTVEIIDACGTGQCQYWGVSASSTWSPLFTGTEFSNSIANYHNVMRPYWNLLSQANNSNSANAERAFIKDAESEGWILAGSYFFDLVRLNGSAAGGVSVEQDDPRMKSSSSNFKASYGHMNSEQMECSKLPGSSSYASLCGLFYKDNSADTLIDLLGKPDILEPKSYVKPSAKAIAGEYASTVYGYIDNASILKVPGQPGLKPLMFANIMNFDFSGQSTALPSANFPCGGVHIVFFTVCIGHIIGTIIYNGIMAPLLAFMSSLIMPVIEQFIMSFLSVPLAGIGEIFKQGMEIIQSPGVNPVVALANMGTYYINFAGQLLFILLNFLIIGIFKVFFLVPFMLLLFAVVMPIFAAWLGVMVGIGIVTAYYIPILPYMIFTFGAIAWLMAVIEAMVAAPIVALGVTHPEGHDVFGKGEAAVMILVNIFLRPTMMIIGFIAGIVLSYVGVWVLNAGFDRAIGFMQGSAEYGTGNSGSTSSQWKSSFGHANWDKGMKQTGDSFKQAGEQSVQGWKQGAAKPMTIAGTTVTGGYTGWAGVFAYFMSILIYIVAYMTIVEKAFSLIVTLPDKVLRWIGGHPESVSSEALQWADQQVKGKVDSSGKELEKGYQQAQKRVGDKVGDFVESRAGEGGEVGGGGGG